MEKKFQFFFLVFLQQTVGSNDHTDRLMEEKQKLERKAFLNLGILGTNFKRDAVLRPACREERKNSFCIPHTALVLR